MKPEIMGINVWLAEVSVNPVFMPLNIWLLQVSVKLEFLELNVGCTKVLTCNIYGAPLEGIVEVRSKSQGFWGWVTVLAAHSVSEVVLKWKESQVGINSNKRCHYISF